MPAEGRRRLALRLWHLATASHSHCNSPEWTSWGQRTHWVRLVWAGPQRSCAPRALHTFFRAESDNAAPIKDPVSNATNALEPHSPTCCADQCESQGWWPLYRHRQVFINIHTWRLQDTQVIDIHIEESLWGGTWDDAALGVLEDLRIFKPRCCPHCLFDCFLTEE